RVWRCLILTTLSALTMNLGTMKGTK
ncbi:hypothetical protein VEx25_0239, partial [Vibrio antiquarius]